MSDEMTTRRQEVFPNEFLSDRDKAFMVINYPRTQVDPTAPEWTLTHALDMMGVDAYDKHAMLRARPEDVRKQFAVWMTEYLLGRTQGISSVGIPGRGLDNRDDSIESLDWCASELHISAEEIRDEERAGADSGPARGVAPNKDLLWPPGSVITYWFQQPEYRAPPPTDPWRFHRRRILLNSFVEWESCSHLQLREATRDGDATVRIFFHENQGPYSALSLYPSSWTEIGRRQMALSRDDKLPGGYDSTTMYLNLPQPRLNEAFNTTHQAFTRRTCLHETGHLLGLRHEAANPRSLQRDYELSPSYSYLPMFWTEWDPFSIMLYPGREVLPGAFGWPELTGFNTEISQWDQALVAVSMHLIYTGPC